MLLISTQEKLEMDVVEVDCLHNQDAAWDNGDVPRNALGEVRDTREDIQDGVADIGAYHVDAVDKEATGLLVADGDEPLETKMAGVPDP